jgi:hypothetical protein
MMLPLLLLVGGSFQPGRASVITSIADSMLTAGGYPAATVIGLIPGYIPTLGNQILIITTGEILYTPDYAESQSLDLQLFGPIPAEMKLGSATTVASLGNVGLDGGVVFAADGLRNLLYQYDMGDQAIVGNQLLVGVPLVTLAFSNGVLYGETHSSIFDSYALYAINANNGTSTEIVATNTYVTGASVLEAGPGGVLYTLGQAVGAEGSCTAGQWCVIGIDPHNGALLSGFALPFDASTSALTVGSDGRFYLATGNGQGYIYSGSGTELDVLSSSIVNAEVNGGDTLLTLDGSGSYLYLNDAATGLHVFDVKVTPEPGEAGMIAAGAALLWLLRRIRERRHRAATSACGTGSTIPA